MNYTMMTDTDYQTPSQDVKEPQYTAATNSADEDNDLPQIKLIATPKLGRLDTMKQRISNMVESIQSKIKMPTIKVEVAPDEGLKNNLDYLCGSIKRGEAYFQDTIKQFLPDTNDEAILSKVIDVMESVLLAVYLIWTSPKELKPLVAYSALQFSGIVTARKAIHVFSTWLYDIFSRVSETSLFAQTGKEQNYQGLCNYVGEAIFGQSYKESFSKKSSKFESFKTLSKDLGAVKSMGQALEYILQSLGTAVNFCYSQIYGQPLMTSKNKKVVEKAMAWMEKTKLYFEIQEKNLLSTLNQYNHEVLQLEVELKELKVEMIKCDLRKNTFPPFYALAAKFEALAEESRSFLRSSRPRVPPIWINLVGEPGAGKSQTANFLNRDTWKIHCSMNGLKEHAKNVPGIYARKADDPFWEGYANQFTVFYDDIWQRDNLDVRSDTACELIFLHNVAPFKLRMASLEKKAGTFFDSRLIVSTSNGPVPKLDIQDRQALLRRVDFDVRVVKNHHYKARSDGFYDTTYARYFMADERGREQELTYDDLLLKVAEMYITKCELAKKIGHSQNSEELSEPVRAWLDKQKPLDNGIPVSMPSIPIVEKDLPTTILETVQYFLTFAQGGDEDTLIIESARSSWRFKNDIAMQQLAMKMPEDDAELFVKVKETLMNHPGFAGNMDLEPEPMHTLQYLVATEFLELCRGIHKRNDQRNMKYHENDLVYRAYWQDGKGWYILKDFKLVPISPDDIVSDHYPHFQPLSRFHSRISKLTFPSKERLDEAAIVRRLLHEESMRDYSQQAIKNIAASKERIRIIHEEQQKHEKNHLSLRIFQAVITVCSGLLLSWGVYKLYNKLSKRDKEDELVVRVDETIEGQGGAATGTGISAGQQLGIKFHSKVRTQEFHRPREIVTIATRAQGQGAAESTAIIMHNRAMNNQAEVTFRYDINKPGRVARITFIEDHIGVTAQHLMTEMFTAEDPYILIRDKTISLHDCKIRQFVQSDIVFIEFPRDAFPSYQKIWDHFITESDLSAGADMSNLMMYLKKGDHIETRSCSDGFYAGEIRYRREQGSDDIHNAKRTFHYSFTTYPAECGSVIGVVNNSIRHKLIGIHVAGGVGYGGYCTVITREMCQYIVNALKPKEAPIVPVEPQSGMEALSAIQEKFPTLLDPVGFPAFDYSQYNLLYIGSVKPKYGHRFPTDTQIEESMMHNYFTPSITAPARLTKAKDGLDEHWPLHNSMTKMKPPPKEQPIDEKLLFTIVDAISATIPRRIVPRLLTEQEAVQGVDTWKYTRHIKRDTATGFQIDKPAGEAGQGKKWMFSFAEYEQPWLMTPTTQNKVYDIMRQHASGKRYQLISELNLKDERLDLAKIWRPRPFVAVPVENQLEIAIVMGAFLENESASRHETGTCDGINPHSREWGELFRSANELGPDWKAFTGDFRQYDWSAADTMIKGYLRYVDNYYATWIPTPEEHRFLSMLAARPLDPLDIQLYAAGIRHGAVSDISMTTCILVGKDLVTPKCSGLLSGGKDTLKKNCNINRQIQSYAIVETSEQIRKALLVSFQEAYMIWDPYHLKSTDEFHHWISVTQGFTQPIQRILEHMRGLYCGDDFVVFLSSELQWYGFDNFKSWAQKHGWNVTTSGKTDEVYVHLQRKDIEFMKRQFHESCGEFFAPMELSNVLEILQYQKKGHGKREAAAQLIEVVLREIFHHGPKIYTNWQTELNEWARLNKVRPFTSTWNELYSNFIVAPREEIKVLNTAVTAQCGYEVLEPRTFKSTEGEFEMMKTVVTGIFERINQVPYKVPLLDNLISALGKRFQKERISNLSILPWKQQYEYLENTWRDIFEIDDVVNKLLTPQIPIFAQSGLEEIQGVKTEGEEEIQGLTKLRDIMPVSEQQLPIGRQPYLIGTDPYPDQGMKPVLERIYRITDITWSGSSVQDTQLYVANFPYALLHAVPNLVDKIQRFCYIRADIEVEFRISGTTFHYGTLMIGWLPNNPSTNQWKLGNIFTMSTCNAHILSANTNTTVKFTIPYVSPRAYWNHADNLNDAYIGQICVRVLNPLALQGSASTPSLTVSVFANFKNIEVAGMTVSTVTYPLAEPESKKMKEEEEFQLVGQGGEESLREYMKNRRIVQLVNYHRESPPVTPKPNTPTSWVVCSKIDTYTWMDDHGFAEDGHNRMHIPCTVIKMQKSRKLDPKFWFYMGPIDKSHVWTSKIRNLAMITLQVEGHPEWFYITGQLYSGIYSQYEQEKKLIVIPAQPKNELTSLEVLACASESRQKRETLPTKAMQLKRKTLDIECYELVQEQGSMQATFSVCKAVMEKHPEILKEEGIKQDMMSLIGRLGAYERKIKQKMQDAGIINPAFAVTIAPQKDPEVLPNVVAQMKREQKEKSETGLLSSTLNAVGTIGANVSKVPFLPPMVQEIGGVAGGLAKNIAGLAAKFGLNKPNSIKAPEPVIPVTANAMSTMEGMNVQHELGIGFDKAMSTDRANFARSFDETQFKAIFSKPGLFDTFTFDSTAAVGAIIKQYYVTPCTCRTVTNGSGTIYFVSMHTPVSLVAYNFQYWRGTLRYRIEIRAGKFTNGRIRVSWHPTYAEIPANFTAGEGDFISTVVEFNGDTTFDFSVPYLKDTLYAECLDTFYKLESGCNGGIAISIVNAATTAQSTGSSLVYVNVYIAGGDDLQFLFYGERRNQYTNQLRWIEDTLQTYSGTIVAQGGTEHVCLDDAFKSDFPPIIAATGLKMSGVTDTGIVEDVMSLMHRFQIYSNVSIPPFTYYLIDPSILQGATGVGPDYPFQLWTSYFLYYRGTFNFKLVRSNDPKNDDGTISVVASRKFAGAPIVPTNMAIPLGGRFGTILEDTTLKPSVEYHLPYYGKYPFVLGWPGWNGAGPQGDVIYEMAHYAYWEPRLNATDAVQLRIFFNCSDDFSFGWGCGCPITWSQHS